MLDAFQVTTPEHSVLVDVTDLVARKVRDHGVANGICTLYVPHTTAAITINEGADPAVAEDLVAGLNKLVPWRDQYRHAEGNSAAHIKTTLVGPSVQIIIDDGTLLLGTWQRIFLCEFDGPRTRKIRMHLLAAD
jgi:secondary thiamine-phosphate synthase enzyme